VTLFAIISAKLSCFMVASGPPSSGKTALVRHVVEMLKVPAISVDLRKADISSKEDFIRALLSAINEDDKLNELYTAASGIIGRLASLKIVNTEFALSTLSKDLKFDSLLQTIEKYAISKQFNKARRPILVIDEANNLYDFARNDPQGLKTFLDFVVAVTKQDSKMHVVFTSSDSFFQEWIQTKLGMIIGNNSTLVLGDLTKSEAFEYYRDEVLCLNPEKSALFSTDEAAFDSVYSLTGGRMFHIKLYVEQVCESGPILSPMGFLLLQQAVALLQEELISTDRKYKREDLIKVFTELTSAKHGYLLYEKLVTQLGKDKVSDMISQNILIYRPIQGLARDLDPPQVAPVVTAVASVALRAMEVLLKSEETL